MSGEADILARIYTEDESTRRERAPGGKASVAPSSEDPSSVVKPGRSSVVDGLASKRAETSQGKRKKSGDGDLSLMERPSTSVRAQGGRFSDVSEDAMKDAEREHIPRDTSSRRRNRSHAIADVSSMEPLRPSARGAGGSLTLVEFSSNARKELNYFDPKTFSELTGNSNNGETERGSRDERSELIKPQQPSLKRGGSVRDLASREQDAPSATESSKRRSQRNTMGGDVRAAGSERRPSLQREGSFVRAKRPSLQRNGSFKGLESNKNGLRRENSLKGDAFDGANEVGGPKPKSGRYSMPRAGSFKGQGTGQASSKDSQRIAHFSALQKQTSWIRVSPVPSPKDSDADSTFRVFTKWTSDLFGLGGSKQETVEGSVVTAPVDAASEGLPERNRNFSRGDSLTNLTRGVDGSEYEGSIRPRDGTSPSERLKYGAARRPSIDDSESSSGYGGRPSYVAPAEINNPFAKVANEKLDNPKFKLDQGQKALEKRLLASSVEAMQRCPGPIISSLNAARKKSPSFFALLDGMSLVTHNFVIGSRYDAEDLAAIRRLGISYVLNITDRIPNYFPDVLIYHRIDIQDKPTTQLDDAFRSAAGFLRRVEANNGRVLIHCVAGVSRSVSIFFMYMMAYHHIKLSSLWYHLYSIRPSIGPNEGFCLQLVHFELEHLGAVSVGKHVSKHWDFYALNSIIGGLPKDYAGSATEQLATECCIIQ